MLTVFGHELLSRTVTVHRIVVHTMGTLKAVLWLNTEECKLCRKHMWVSLADAASTRCAGAVCPDCLEDLADQCVLSGGSVDTKGTRLWMKTISNGLSHENWYAMGDHYSKEDEYLVPIGDFSV